MFSIFYFFLSNNTYFELIDSIYDYKGTHEINSKKKDQDLTAEQNSVVKQFNKKILHNLQKVILLIFDHDRAMSEYKTREISL